MNPRVLSAQPEPDYTLLLTFKNGERRRYDVKPLLDCGIFRQLRDPAVFNDVKTYHCTVHWADGEIDICPDTLYLDSIAS